MTQDLAWVAAQFLLLGLLLTLPGDSGGWWGLPLVLAGLIIVVLGLFNLGRNLTPLPTPIESGQLVTTGIYGWIRHPLYSGLIVGALGWSLWQRSWLHLLLTLLLALVLDAKARYEEGLLNQAYPAYAGYRQRVKKFIPGVY